MEPLDLLLWASLSPPTSFKILMATRGFVMRPKGHRFATVSCLALGNQPRQVYQARVVDYTRIKTSSASSFLAKSANEMAPSAGM